MFERAIDHESAAQLLHVEWHPQEALSYLGVPAAREVLSRLRCRALGLEIAALYPAANPWAVEAHLIQCRLLAAPEPPRVLEHMIRRGMRRLPWVGRLSDPVNRQRPLSGRVESYFGRFVRDHTSCHDVLFSPIWTLLDPSPLLAAQLAVFAFAASEAGAPAWLLCRDDHDLTEADRYETLLRMALDPALGRPLALLCALIELRHAERRGDLAAYATCLAAIPDITAFPDRDSLFAALTGFPAGDSDSKEASWQFDERYQAGQFPLMHVTDYLAATFARVVVAALTPEQTAAYVRLLHEQGLDVDGWPRHASLGEARVTNRLRSGPPAC